MWINENMNRIVSGISKIDGDRNYSNVNQLVDVSERFLSINHRMFVSFLGCFACFCPCCFGCKLAKYLGESSVIGCCPGSLSYFRTKLRTARRIEVDIQMCDNHMEL